MCGREWGSIGGEERDGGKRENIREGRERRAQPPPYNAITCNFKVVSDLQYTKGEYLVNVKDS